MDSSFNLAVHALVCLSHSGRSLSSEALAENICTNPTRVRRVMAGLKKAGMVETREGLDGGYRLTADPASLTLRQVAEAVNTRFVDCAWHSGDIDRDCEAFVLCTLNKHQPQQDQQRKARHAEDGDDEGVEEIQPQRKLGEHAERA